MRWIKSRSISELIIAPLADSLSSISLAPGTSEEEQRETPALTVLGGCRVSGLELGPDGTVNTVRYSSRTGDVALDVDACVLSLGARGMNAVMGGSAALARQAPELSSAAALPSIDVIACR